MATPLGSGQDAARLLTRRDALRRVAGGAQGSVVETMVVPVTTPPPRGLAPRTELVNVLEFEAQAERALTSAHVAGRAGWLKSGDRAPFDRITLRPRMCVPATDLDLGITLFGERHFAPIIVGPVASQRGYHVDGEAATILGANAAQAGCVLTSGGSTPLERLPASTAPRWYQVFADSPLAARNVAYGLANGCTAVCATAGVDSRSATQAAAPWLTRSPIDWSAVRALRRQVSVPMIVKGIGSAADARAAIDAGVDGVVVSDYAAWIADPKGATILQLASIVDAVAGKVPVLVDGGFVRGSDIIKALAFGASAVLVARPVMWGLAAYGADGVQSVLEMLQTELARFMAMSGHVDVASLGRDLVRVHAR